MSELKVNPIQKEAIEFASGAMQVLAGPGSGKTFVITQRIRYLIENYKIEPESILVITFTKAAAMEMQQRFYKLMQPARPPVNFGTFHAIFYHILRQSGKYRNYTLIKETEKRRLLLRLLKLPDSNAFINDERIDALIKYISAIKNEGGNAADFEQETFEKDELVRIYTEYNIFLDEFKKLDFDDMGLLCLKLFEENPAVLSKWQEKYRYLMVDEFQDVNYMQYRIVQKIAGETPNLFIVGDDDQSIYGFRGAKPDIMRRFMEEYKDAGQLLLNVNYRCHEDIVDKSLKVIKVNKNRYDKQISASHADGKGVVLMPYQDQESEYNTLIDKLKEFRKINGDGGLTNIAAIYRTNYECSLFAEKLLMNGIPFIMKEKFKSRYEHFAIKDILAYMEFAAGNRRRELFHLFMNRPLRYLRKDCAVRPETELKELLDYYKDNKTMCEVSADLFSSLEHIKSMRPYLAVNYIRKVIGYDIYLKENYDASSYDKFTRILDDFQKEARMFDSFRKFIDYISQCKELEENKLKDNNNETKNGIQLMTMHASKGLEFDTVILADVNEGKIPPKQSDTPEASEEERRMFYVAMTRAKKNLYILYCQGKNGKDTPSRFLEPLL